MVLGFGKRKREAVTAALVPLSAAPYAPGDPTTFPVSSPWGTSAALERIVFEDILGIDIDALPMSRQVAMRLGTIKRGRRLLCSTIAKLPLRLMTGDTLAPVQPGWLTAAALGQSPQVKMAWTVDDLIFYDWSLWGRILVGDELAATWRVPHDRWSTNDRGQVLIDDVVQSDEQVILVGGTGDGGILVDGRDILEDARTLYRNYRQRLQTPMPPMELHQEGGEPLTPDQIDGLLALWRRARRNPEGAVAFTPASIKANVLASGDDGQLMIEGRNAAAVDLARLIGVSAGMVDATTPKASLNYETQTGRNEEFMDLDVDAYMTPITARLSLDDVCEPGTHIAFDTTDETSLTPEPTGPDLAD